MLLVLRLRDGRHSPIDIGGAALIALVQRQAAAVAHRLLEAYPTELLPESWRSLRRRYHDGTDPVGISTGGSRSLW